jgi:hypothetical protein
VSKTRYLIFTLILAAFSVVFIELVLHAAYGIKRGVPIWKTAREEFSVRDYTVLTGDARVFTARKGADPGPLNFDANGFRHSDGHQEAQNGQIVFLGDSVPFGMGLKAEQTVPSALARRLEGRKLGVINAALPSYSLRQAISRFRMEIAGRWKVRAVILQVYDPATQFAMFGRQWSLDDNWANQDAKLARIKDRKEGGIRSLLRYSAIYHLYRSLKPGKGDPRLSFRLSQDDAQAIAFFKQQVTGELAGFLEELRASQARLFLLPIAHSNPQTLTPGLKLSTETLNAIYADFAQINPDAILIDQRPSLALRPREEMFIDDSGHLSPEGAEVQADVIAAALKRAGLLD